MTHLRKRREPTWPPAFLDALKAGKTPVEAARIARTTHANAALRRRRHPDFARAWAECEIAGDARLARPAVASVTPGTKRATSRLDRFVDELAASSNVTAAAGVAGLTVSAVYKLRRTDPQFARRWFAALAEGYDNLEMELLCRLRGGDKADQEKGKFDTAAALRCLAAHRESVAREKGRRALADEVTTIASINAKIDKLRLNGEAGARAMAEAREAKANKDAG